MSAFASRGMLPLRYVSPTRSLLSNALNFRCSRNRGLSELAVTVLPTPFARWAASRLLTCDRAVPAVDWRAQRETF
jgi:hypothetical protein